MSNKFNNFNNLYNSWKKKCEETVKEVVPSVMKDKMQEAIEYEVYAKYTPKSYIRRKDNGGLLDKNNMVERIEVNKQRITVYLFNNTLGNDKYKYHTNDYIDSIIVTGRGYTWKSSEIYKNPIKRDFYKETEKLLNDGELRNAIIKELRQKGIIVV